MPRNSPSGWSARAIAASFERSVQMGRLGAAEALPPVRELAQKLRVSPATVAAAYRLLRSRGLTSAEGRRGTRVLPRVYARATASHPRSVDGSIDLATGNPDAALLPSLAGAIPALDPEPALYDRAPHLPRLLRFVAAEFEADGVPASAMTMVSGGLDAVERVLREHLRPGDHVALEDPAFPALRDLLEFSGYVAVPFALDEEGPIPASVAAALRKNCRACVITSRAQNPSGCVISAARARELQTVLRRAPDVLLIETDPCGPVAGAPLATVIDPSRHRWVHIKSTSKFLGPDLRLAFLSGDAMTICRVEGRFASGPRRVSLLLQQIVLALWSDPSAARTLARASEVYRSRRDALRSRLSSRGVAVHGVSGFNLWLPVRHEVGVVQALADRGWTVAAGEPFRLQSPPGIRVSVARLVPDDAARLAADIADAIDVPRSALA